jgi:hypothetical protein
MNIDQWLDQAKAQGESETLIHVVSTLANEHAPIHPTYNVAVNEQARQTWLDAVKAGNMLDFDPWARPDLWKEEQAEFVDCNTCPDIAGWPCPVRLSIARCLGVDPE